jgi:dolichyl-diphosphooligosaccharide--protein glycosyltransferase
MVNKKKETSKKVSIFNTIISIANKKEMKVIVPIVMVLFAMWFAFLVRSGPITLDSLDQRIEANVMQQISQALSAQIDQQYPNINPQFKQQLLQKELAKVQSSREINLGGQQINVDDLIQQQSLQAKQLFQAENGQTYLTAIDPYHFIQLAENYNKNGHTGTNIIDGKPVVEYKIAPENSYPGTYSPEFHVWLESKILKFSGVTNDSPIGEQTKPIFSLSAIIAMLSVIPIFFLLRLISQNNSISLFGSLLLVSLGTFVSRTVAGFVDTDGYQVLFSLCVVASLIASFYSNTQRVSIFFGILSGLFMGLFIWAWSNGWFIFVFAIVSLIGYLVYILIDYILLPKKTKQVTKTLQHTISYLVIKSGVFLVSSFIFVKVFAKQNIFTISYNGAFRSLSGDIATISTNIWPNVLSSVAELAKASFSQIINSVGGSVVFFIALFGLLGLSLDGKFEKRSFTKKESIKVWLYIFATIWFVLFISGTFSFLSANYKLVFISLLFLPIGLAILYHLFFGEVSPRMFVVFILSIWMAGTIYMSFNGVRFILLLAPAFSVAFGLGMYYIEKLISSFVSKEIKFGDVSRYNDNNFSFGSLISVIVVFLVIFIPMAQNAKAIGDNTLPNFDDAWYEGMYKIKNETAEDTIITSWWDFGHFFATVADRGVTFDGGSQTTPQSHWVGKFLLESDEQVAKDILRMLVCGGNKAFDTFNSFTDGTDADAVKINRILYQTFGNDQEETRRILKENPYYTLTEEQIDEIMGYLSCSSPRPSLVITSGDMVGKAAVWAHWGSWDFTKKYVFNHYKKLSAEEIAQNIDENVSLIQQYVEDLQKIDVTAETQNVNKEQLQNQWFAPYPSFAGNVPCQLNNKTLVCPQAGFEFDITTGDVLNKEQLQYPIHQVIIPTSLGITQKFMQDEKGVMDVILVGGAQGQFTAIFAQAPLGDSMFSKLYYMQGVGTSFEKFYEAQSQTAGRISFWKTNWNETNTSQFSPLSIESINSN